MQTFATVLVFIIFQNFQLCHSFFIEKEYRLYLLHTEKKDKDKAVLADAVTKEERVFFCLIFIPCPLHLTPEMKSWNCGTEGE